MATTTRRYLVIANQTLAEAELNEAIHQRLEQGPSSFYLLVPNTKAADLAARIARGAPIAPAASDATVDALATEHAQHRLGQLLDDLRGMGVDVDGDLGDEDPIKAVDQLRERRQFDEIILSTLPQPISKWLGMDLPHRLHRHTGLPVTTITAKRVV
jgi:GABA permease